MSFTRKELEKMSFSKLLKVAKFSEVSTYRKKKEDIIDELEELFLVRVEEVVEADETPRSVRVQRIYESSGGK